MFMLKKLKKDIFLPADKLTTGIEYYLKSELIGNIEGRCVGKLGYVISVVDILNISNGVIQDHTGETCFNIEYTALLLRPYKNEVLDAIVSEIHKMGFFCEIGPLSIFISTHQMPDYLIFDASGMPIFQSLDKSIRIEKNERVRLRIIGTRIDASNIFAVGSIKEDYLGVL
eukprot:GHVP01048291.1.p1 GENE.GHVP01048291.1~~GHVP01048291.1.p1  ORF type:complete len:171 (+),score=27.26 GHVP01048291.1:196-708(+)